MKRIISVIMVLAMILVMTTGCSAKTEENITINLQIGSPIMTVNGVEKEIDPGRNTTPIVEKGRTILPVRAIVEAMGGSVEWDEETQTTVLAKNDVIILLKTESNIAFVGEKQHTLDTAPTVINDRTMLPIRFIAENLGFGTKWNKNTQTVTLTTGNQKAESEQENVMTTDKTNQSKSIVVYFSQTGNTRPFAENIASTVGADIYEINAQIPYTADDINYNNNESRVNREQNDGSVRPEIAGETIDLSSYDTVYLGYPIWWGTLPKIIYTFMDTYDLSGKTIMPFCTSHSSGISSSVSAIEQYCKGSNVKNGLRGSAQTTESDIKEWIKNNELNQ